MHQNHDTELGTVYFVQDYAGSAVKIGFSRNPLRRLLTIQISQPYPIVPLGSCPGSLGLERALHAEFANTRLLGEWFERTDALMDRIKELCDDSVDCLKGQKRLRRIAKRFGPSSTNPATRPKGQPPCGGM